MIRLFIFIGIVLAAALFGSIGSQYGVDTWYPGLTRPIWNPPDWVFPPMWTLLYITIAVAGWLFWTDAPSHERVFPMILWATQLFFNAIWSWIFFFFQSPYYALWDIAILWMLILLTIVSFWSIQRWASIILVPYFGWVTFAGVLNFWIYSYNR
jgi:benzodiazapine receptor